MALAAGIQHIVFRIIRNLHYLFGMTGFIKTVLSVAAATGIFCHAQAQTFTRSTDTAKKNQPAQNIKPKGPKPITREVSMGFKLNTDGNLLFNLTSIFFQLGRVRSKDLKHSDMFYNVRY